MAWLDSSLRPTAFVDHLAIAIQHIYIGVGGEKSSNLLDCTWQIKVVRIEPGDDFSVRTLPAFVNRSSCPLSGSLNQLKCLPYEASTSRVPSVEPPSMIKYSSLDNLEPGLNQ